VSTANTSANPATGSLTASCSFADNAAVTINNGGTTQSTTASATGGLTLTYGATDPTLSIDGGTFVNAAYGVNTVTATGLNAAGGTNTATFLIDIENPSATTGSGTGLAFTGADLAALLGAALALILMGAAVVVYTRRRAASVR
jgi:hypothetical protein